MFSKQLQKVKIKGKVIYDIILVAVLWNVEGIFSLLIELGKLKSQCNFL